MMCWNTSVFGKTATSLNRRRGARKPVDFIQNKITFLIFAAFCLAVFFTGVVIGTNTAILLSPRDNSQTLLSPANTVLRGVVNPQTQNKQDVKQNEYFRSEIETKNIETDNNAMLEENLKKKLLETKNEISLLKSQERQNLISDYESIKESLAEVETTKKMIDEMEEAQKDRNENKQKQRNEKIEKTLQNRKHEQNIDSLENSQHQQSNVDQKPQKEADVPPNFHKPKMSPPFELLGGNRYVEYKDGLTPRSITSEMKEESDKLALFRREAVRDAMKHAWEGYRKYAWGQDELRPISKRGIKKMGDIGTTLVDSLDTLWLMGMKEEFWEARDWVRDHLSFDHVGAVSFFETTIRSLGGLLAAYDLSEDDVFLEKADDLGSRLFHAFASPSGLPYANTELNGTKSFNNKWAGKNSILAEIGTMQIEFRYLANATGKQHYADKANKVFEELSHQQPESGLFPVFYNIDKSQITVPKRGNVAFGALGDSFYEYLLKVWLQGGKKESYLREMYDKAMDGLHHHLVQKSLVTGLTYIADLNQNRMLDHKMDHLACFMAGSLALGAYTHPDGLESVKARRDLKTGKALAYTCYQMYARMKTGLSPEAVRFIPSRPNKDFIAQIPIYILRPETAESLFILNKLTGDPIYREWGWEIFQAIEKYCRTEVGYASIKDVDDPSKGQSDSMESFFLAETLKYLYLLQDPDTEIDILNKHVFNTEAHPLRMFHGLDQTKSVE